MGPIRSAIRQLKPELKFALPAAETGASDQSFRLMTNAEVEKEVKRRADVVGIFPNEASIIRLIGAVLLEQNDEWQLQHRYMQVEAMAELAAPANEAEARQIASAA
jgi:hypothetical protein